MKVHRKIIEINEELCDGCGQCIVDCAEAALELIDGKAKLVAEKYCDGLGACLGSCPTGALKIIEKEADDFDEEAVEELLKTKEKEETPSNPLTLDCGCPSAQLQNFQTPPTPCQGANNSITDLDAGSHSNLSHWPIQIRLIPPSAPFLHNADLLISADCTAVATANFHSAFLKNRVIMMGCPKFDDAKSYVAKFSEIFSTVNVNSITVLIMEVPCCQSMRNIVKEALNNADKNITTEVVTVSTRGKIINKTDIYG